MEDICDMFAQINPNDLEKIRDYINKGDLESALTLVSFTRNVLTECEMMIEHYCED